MTPLLQPITAVWHRHMLTWVRQWRGTFLNSFGNPAIFLAGFSLGMGTVVDEMADVPYLAFVLPGVMLHVAAFQGGFELVINGYGRMIRERMWNATLATPVSLHNLLMGEVLWAATKGAIAGWCMLLIGWIAGGILTGFQAILIIPLVFFLSLVNATCGMFYLSFIRTSYDQNAYFTFFVFPALFFSGTYFEISRMPEWLQWLVQIFPQTHAIVIGRALTAGTPLTLAETFYHFSFMITLAIVCYILGYRRIKRRLLS